MFPKRFTIRSMEDIEQLVEDYGILPFFENRIEGFSIEEHIDPALWFSGIEGPWEWKGPIIRKTNCAYGKFFGGKAAFISRTLFPDFANFRRDGYDFDALYDDGLAPLKHKELYDLIEPNAPILSKELKALGGYSKNGKKGFDPIITKLQHRGYVLISDFVYMTDRYGTPYGWGVAAYSTPERFMGDTFCNEVYRHTPEQSRARIVGHIGSLFSGLSVSEIEKFIK